MIAALLALALFSTPTPAQREGARAPDVKRPSAVEACATLPETKSATITWERAYALERQAVACWRGVARARAKRIAAMRGEIERLEARIDELEALDMQGRASDLPVCISAPPSECASLESQIGAGAALCAGCAALGVGGAIFLGK